MADPGFLEKESICIKVGGRFDENEIIWPHLDQIISFS